MSSLLWRLLQVSLFVLAVQGPALASARNPYMPLSRPVASVLPSRPLPPPPLLPSASPGPFAPLASAPPAPPRSLIERLEFIGVAFDKKDAIAAVQLDGKVFFVRKGDQLGGAEFVEITPHKLYVRQGKRVFLKHLHRDTGAI